MASDRARCGCPLYISGQRVKELLGMKDVLEVVEKGLIAFSAGADGGVIQPVRSVIPIRDHSGLVLERGRVVALVDKLPLCTTGSLASCRVTASRRTV